MKKKPEITNNELAQKIDGLGESLSEKITTSLGELALSTKKGFDDAQEQFDDLKYGQKTMNARLVAVESGVEDIKLRLGYHAPQFEVDQLKQRVTRLEKKTGLA